MFGVIMSKLLESQPDWGGGNSGAVEACCFDVTEAQQANMVITCVSIESDVGGAAI
jgi:hypothetical protein